MWDSLERDGRGSQFDDVVEELGLAGRQSVAELVRVYRHHRPTISLPRRSRAALEELRPRPLYLVTDGHKVVQQNKIDALGLAPYLPPRLPHPPLRHPQPQALGPGVRADDAPRALRAPSDIVYVGDDPSKDFRGIRPLGVHTIRVRTGPPRPGRSVPADEDAERTVAGIGRGARRGRRDGAGGRMTARADARVVVSSRRG